MREREKRPYTINIVPSSIADLSLIIPVFLVIDEAQAWQRVELADGNKGETALHRASSEVARLINYPVLLIFAGTRYTIFSQLGGTVGSPLRGKVEKRLITLLSKEDVEEYADI